MGSFTEYLEEINTSDPKMKGIVSQAKGVPSQVNKSMGPKLNNIPDNPNKRTKEKSAAMFGQVSDFMGRSMVRSVNLAKKKKKGNAVITKYRRILNMLASQQ
jgi:hypothetical protein